MPTYRITDPTTGKTVKITGDSEPSEQELNEIFSSIGGDSAASQATEMPADQSKGIGALPGDIDNRGQNVADIWSKKQNPVSKVWQTLGEAGGVVGDVATRAMQTAAPIIEGAATVGGARERDWSRPAMLNGVPVESKPIPGVEAAAGKVKDAAQGAAKTYRFFKEDNPELAGNLEAGVKVFGGMTAGAFQGKMPVGQFVRDAKSLVPSANNALKALPNVLNPKVATADEVLSTSVKEGISKGVRPKVAGKPDFSRHSGFYDDAEDGVRTIAENRSSLNIVDDAGNTVQYPKTAGQMAQAIDQAKNLVYKKYHQMALEAGDIGAVFDSKPILSKLQKLSDPEGPYKGNSAAQAHAQSLINDIAQLDGASPEIVQERIRELNESLAGYFAGRNEKVAARIDASVANLMREELDSKIASAVGDGYQELKNKYGSLKTIEKEVNHRALMNAKKAPKNVADLTDIFTGGELASGLLTANPALIAKGASGKIIKEIIQKINDPDRAIAKMFRTAYGVVDELPPPPPESMKQLGSGALGSDLISPTFARRGMNPENAIRSDIAAQSAKLEANEAERQALKSSQLGYYDALTSGIRSTRPKVNKTPNQELVEAMRKYQSGGIGYGK